MRINDVAVEPDALLPVTVERDIRRYGGAWVDGTTGVPATLTPLLPVATYVRSLDAALGSVDLSALTEFTELESLSIKVRPRRLTLHHGQLSSLNVGLTPVIRKALVNADLPNLIGLQLMGAAKGLLAESLPIRPEEISLMYAGDLRDIDPTQPWLSRVTAVSIYRAGPLNLAALAALPALRHLELHSVNGLEAVGDVGEQLHGVDVLFQNCHRVSDPAAILALQARSITLVGDNYPITRGEAALITDTAREPSGPWRLPIALGGGDPYPPAASETDSDFGVPIYMVEMPEHLQTEDYVPATRDRLTPILRDYLESVTSEQMTNDEYGELALRVANAYVISAGDAEAARDELAEQLAVGWRLELGEHLLLQLWYQLQPVLDGTSTHRE